MESGDLLTFTRSPSPWYGYGIAKVTVSHAAALSEDQGIGSLDAGDLRPTFSGGAMPGDFPGNWARISFAYFLTKIHLSSWVS